MQAIRGIQQAVKLAVGLLLITLVVAVGIFLGSLINSPNWTGAMRLVGLSGVISAILINPFNGLLLWIILEPYQKFWYLNIHMPRGIPDLSLNRIAIAFLCITWVAQLAIGKKKLRRPSGVEISMLIFCIMALPSVAASLEGLQSGVLVLFDKLITTFFVFVLVKNFYEDRVTLDKVAAMSAVIGIYLCFMVFYEHITGQALFYTLGRTTVYTQHLRKIVSLLGNPAYIATVLAMILPMTLYKFVKALSAPVRAFYGALSIIVVLGNFFCYNRGGWLALAVTLLILLFFDHNYRKILLPFVLIVAVLALIFWRQINESSLVAERLFSVNPIQFRLVMLEMSKKMIRDHLLFGVGFDNFAHYYFEYGGYWSIFAPVLPTPHNTYILVLTTMGLVSFIPYILIFLSMFLEMGNPLRRACKDKSIDQALLVSGWAVIAAYTVSAVAIDIYISTFVSLIFFCLTGAILGYVSRTELFRAPMG